MPMFDYKASQIEEFSALIEKLAQYEADIENAKQHRDKNLRKRAGKDVRKLLSQVDPSTIFLFAAGTNVVNSDALRSEWQLQASNVTVRDFLRGWSLESFFNNVWKNLEPDLTILPRYSLAISFQFRLAQPYLSKDDDAFYIIDNPVRKDKVFKTPIVAPSSWKGSLRHALWQLGHRHDGKEHTDEQVKRMFGETRDDDIGQSGRLFFYPTFFDRMSLEIINPHDRVRRVGKNPILFESVPVGASGRFTLLYVPFDRIGKDEAETRRQVAADLILLAEGLQAMFTFYGFGAKTSSGFGVAEDTVEDGHLVLKWPGFVFPQAEDAQVQKPSGEYLKYMDETGQIKPDFRGSGKHGLMSNKEYKERGQQAGGGSLSEFKAFRGWYEKYGQKWQQMVSQEAASGAGYSPFNFESLNQLAEVLRQMGGEV